jgi:hypothetical protein
MTGPLQAEKPLTRGVKQLLAVCDEACSDQRELGQVGSCMLKSGYRKRNLPMHAHCKPEFREPAPGGSCERALVHARLCETC